MREHSAMEVLDNDAWHCRCCRNRKRATPNDAARSCRGNRALENGERRSRPRQEAGDAGIAKLKRAENDGETPRSSWSPCSPLSLFCGRSSGYQIFAAPLANNASLDKPESLFTIAGYSFVAFFPAS